MLDASRSATEKRQLLRSLLDRGDLLRLPGAINPLSALLIEEIGFEGVYVSGAVMSAELGLPDIGLTTLSEVTTRAQQIARVTNLPAIVDADTGFGEPMNVARSIESLEAAGLAGCHIEDQVNPKRCGHLDGKEIVDRSVMHQRIAAALGARRDPNFLICARTDARSVEGLDAAIERARSYVEVGAEAIFPEALEDAKEFEVFRSAIGVPLIANMTEFGKSELLSAQTLRELGINMVIYPVTLLRIAMGAIERGLRVIDEQGSQTSLVGEMQTRARLYELIDYESFNEFDDRLYYFTLNPKESGHG